MKNYMDAVRAAGIGRTPQLCQDALIETLEELFAGKKYNGQQSRKELKIFKQDLPVPEDYDADVDTDAAAAPVHRCAHDRRRDQERRRAAGG